MSKDELSEAVRSDGKGDEHSLRLSKEVDSRVNNSEEIMDAYEGALVTTGERISISRSLLEKGIRESGIKGGNIGFAEQIEGTWLNFDELDEGEQGKNRPQVWMKPVVETKHGLFGTKQVQTDEVLIISRMNNAEDENDSTIVFGLVKQKDGIPQIGKGKPGFYGILSQEDYQEIINKPTEQLREEYPSEPTKKLLKKFFRGESTISRHKKDFITYTGNTYKFYWKKRDEKIKDTPAHWRSREHLRQGFVESLEDDYRELMQETVRRNGKVHDEVKKELQQGGGEDVVKEEIEPVEEEITSLSKSEGEESKPEEGYETEVVANLLNELRNAALSGKLSTEVSIARLLKSAGVPEGEINRIRAEGKAEREKA